MFVIIDDFAVLSSHVNVWRIQVALGFIQVALGFI